MTKQTEALKLALENIYTSPPAQRKPLTDEQFLELLLRTGTQELVGVATFVGGSIQMQGKIGLLRSAKIIKEFVEAAHGITGEHMSYNMIDRFLRNNLYDDDYEEFSAALDSLCTSQRKQWEGLEPEDFDGVIKSDAFEAGAYWANNKLREKNSD